MSGIPGPSTTLVTRAGARGRWPKPMRSLDVPTTWSGTLPAQFRLPGVRPGSRIGSGRRLRTRPRQGACRAAPNLHFRDAAPESGGLPEERSLARTVGKGALFSPALPLAPAPVVHIVQIEVWGLSSQSSIRRFGTRLNSDTLWVTRINEWARVVEAIMRSLGPIGCPKRSRSARISP